MTRADLLALAERVEREEPSWELDDAIATAIDAPRGWIGATALCRAYTSSLDAAASLVPEGAVWWDLYFERGWERGPARAEVSMFRRAPVTRRGFAASPAAALTAAALRAIAMETPDDQ